MSMCHSYLGITWHPFSAISTGALFLLITFFLPVAYLAGVGVIKEQLHEVSLTSIERITQRSRYKRACGASNLCRRRFFICSARGLYPMASIVMSIRRTTSSMSFFPLCYGDRFAFTIMIQLIENFWFFSLLRLLHIQSRTLERIHFSLVASKSHPNPRIFLALLGQDRRQQFNKPRINVLPKSS